MSIIIFFSLIVIFLLIIGYVWELIEERNTNAQQADNVERTWLTRPYSENEAIHLHYHLRIYHSAIMAAQSPPGIWISTPDSLMWF
ncbi:hypothetical protein N9180_01660, partial [Akkermansiaceae bacterium]|nr:hypothetical protein [Akkermansiaceae bacterium]